MHPAHVPLMCEAQAAVLNGMGYLRPCSRLLGDHHNTGISASDRGIKLLEELDCLEILIAAVLVRNVILTSVISVKHGAYGIYTQTVDMEFIDPEYCVRDKE